MTFSHVLPRKQSERAQPARKPRFHRLALRQARAKAKAKLDLLLDRMASDRMEMRQTPTYIN